MKKKSKPPSPACIRALRIIEKSRDCTLLPGMFATQMWPDAPRRGNLHTGGGDNMAVCAGGLLGRMQKAGLINYAGRGKYRLTEKSREILRQDVLILAPRKKGMRIR